MQSYQNVVMKDVPIEVRLQSIAAIVNKYFLDILSAKIPVKSTAVAKNTVNVAPAKSEYFSVVKFGIA